MRASTPPERVERLPERAARLPASVAALVFAGTMLGFGGTTGCVSTDTRSLPRFEYRRVLLGVEARLVIYARSERAAERAARAAYARIAELDAIFSDYRRDSEIERLARAAGDDASPASDELLAVMTAALELARRSRGAFDPTVGPLTRAWRDARDRGEPPCEDAVARARARALVDWRAVEIDPLARTLRLAREGMRLDLGGIAKGYAADEALAVLSELGARRSLVELGGDVAAGDPPPGAAGWRVAVEGLGVMLVLANEAVATSGGAAQYLDVEGGGSHLVDPRTGRGLRSRDPVTVVARSAMLADGLASAVAVAGRERGRRLVRSYHGARVLQLPADEGP